MGVLTYTKGASQQLSPNFKSYEFDCHGNGCCNQTKIDSTLVDYLQDIRTHFGKSVTINSGYRCPTHNSRIGGASGSKHRYGQAADIVVNGIAPAEVAKYAESIGVLGIGLYEGSDGNFVHIDTRTSKAFWYGHAQKYRSTFGGKKIETTKPTISISKEGIISSNSDEYTQKIWNFLMNKINNPYGVAGLMGNLYAESAMCSNNLENVYESKLGLSDNSYTQAVDNGSYSNFVKDAAGYGLAQWTYWTRKQGLLEYAKEKNKSIGDYEIQLEFLYKELNTSYKSVLSVLKTATTVQQASNKVLFDFENPKDQSPSVQATRAQYGQNYFDKYANKNSINVKKTLAGTGIGMATAKTAMHIRQEPTSSSKSYGIIKKGQFVEVLEKLSSGWYKIVWDNAEYGYAYTSNTTGTYYDFNTDNIDNNIKYDYDGNKEFQVKVTASALNVRANVGTNYRITGLLKKNTVHTIIEEKDGWGKLKSGKGWIKLSYTKRIS